MKGLDLVNGINTKKSICQIFIVIPLRRTIGVFLQENVLKHLDIQEECCHQNTATSFVRYGSCKVA